MTLQVCKDSKDWVAFASQWCADWNLKTQARSFFLPAGETPVPLYRFWNQEKPAFLSGHRLLQIDEVLGGAKIFYEFFRQELSNFSSQLVPIDGASDIADLCLLGLGKNGHVAFHEPGIPKNFFSGCVPLTTVTCNNLKQPLGTKGVTYGVGAFRRSKAILMLVRGAHKRSVLQQALNGTVDCPAHWLLDHPAITILTDFDF